jgi:hypothetical protein
MGYSFHARVEFENKKMTENGENIGGGNAQRVPARIEKLEEVRLSGE